MIGVDVSEDAVAWPARTPLRWGSTSRLSSGICSAVRRCDAVLANLPYVADGVPLAPEIARYEPRGALFAGPDGLDVIRRLVATLDAVPFVALEIGFDQADAVEALVSGAGFAHVERLRDLAGHERVIVGRR